MLSLEIKHKIDSLRAKFWSEGISNEVDFVEQISYLFFAFMLNKLYYSESENVGGNSNIDDNGILLDLNESIKLRREGKCSANSLYYLLKEKIFPYFRTLNKGNFYYAAIVENSELKVSNKDLLADVFDFIDSLFLHKETEKENKLENQYFIEDVYEYILSGLSGNITVGEFYTPRKIVNTVIEMLSPESDDTIFDPACGSGGFLTTAHRYTVEKEKKGGKTYIGFDSNPRMIKLCLMNMMLNQVNSGFIFQGDALMSSESLPQKFDVIASNPPVGLKIDDYRYSARFRIQSNKSEILFLQLILEKLNISGRCAVLVPEGLLNGASQVHTSIREMLINEYRIDGLVSLPVGAFKPYTNGKASILFVTKPKDNRDIPHTKKVWFYELNEQEISNFERSNNYSIKIENTDIINSWKNRDKDWNKWVKENNSIKDKNQIYPNKWLDKNAWFASYELLMQSNFNLSARIYKPENYEVENFNNPEAIIEDVLAKEKYIVEQLEKLLKETRLYE